MRADLQKHFSIGEKIYKYEFVKNEDYKFSPKRGKTSKQGGRPTDDYSLTLDMAKELSMVENMICAIRMM